MGGEATLEAVPGGAYRVITADGVQAVGEVVEVDRPLPPIRLALLHRQMAPTSPSPSIESTYSPRLIELVGRTG
jgi:hypothetical protein